ncbi:MAG TPA: alpha-galactosidase, partial [Novosphingobium sp.]|nr:alpha-galactosidase [Novosphingobium sp.]
QRGFLQFLPPEVMGSHVGTAPAHTTGRSQPLAFRAAVALQGHFGVELDPERLDAAETDALRGWIGFYKDWRGHLHGSVWNGVTADGLVWHAAGTPHDWVLLVYRTEPAAQPFPALLPLPFADPAARYAVARIGPDRRDPEAVFDGTWLARAGLALPPLHAERAVIYHGQAQ